MKDSTTEEKILAAAVAVFHKKGMAGARMQEIADEAKINKAMLHYYFRSKQQLFEAVFQQAFKRLAPLINGIFNSDLSVFDKIRAFTDSYISFVMENPFLPTFLINEINGNPDFAKKFFEAHDTPNPQLFAQQIANEVNEGLLKPIEPKQLLLDLISLTAFSFVATGMVKGILKIDDENFRQMMEERKQLIPELLINAITP